MKYTEQQLKELDHYASSGTWGQYSHSHGPWKDHCQQLWKDDRKTAVRVHDTSHNVSCMQDGRPKRLATFTHAADAALAEALVNAYRQGDLVWKGSTPPTLQSIEIDGTANHSLFVDTDDDDIRFAVCEVEHIESSVRIPATRAHNLYHWLGRILDIREPEISSPENLELRYDNDGNKRFYMGTPEGMERIGDAVGVLHMNPEHYNLGTKITLEEPVDDTTFEECRAGGN